MEGIIITLVKIIVMARRTGKNQRVWRKDKRRNEK